MRIGFLRKIFTRLCKRFVLYTLMISVSLLILASILIPKPGVNILCPCSSVKKTEERVQKYLPKLMREKNHLTNRRADEEAERGHPSLPVKFLADAEYRGQRCSVIPGLFDIKHRNTLWQEASIMFTTFLLFSAYADYRDEKEGTLVRILAMTDSSWPFIPTCQFYNAPDDGPIQATKAVRMDYMHWQYPVKDNWYPYLITCRVGDINADIPRVVSLVGHPCSEPTNALRINDYNRSKKKNKMALCHKFLYNPAHDYSLRLIEWLEASRAWGIDRVTFYLTATHSNVEKVLKYYQKTGFVELVPWTNPGDQPNIPFLHQALFDTQRFVVFTDENIPYTDCLLRHIGTHRYVGVWDIDEFVFPIKTYSIPDMVDEAYNQWKTTFEAFPSVPPTSYLVRTSYFFLNTTDVQLLQRQLDKTNVSRILSLKTFSEKFHMLSHTTRTVQFTPPNVHTKAIHDTSRALILHAHFALFNLEGQIDKNSDLLNLYPETQGFLGHFRDGCQGENQSDCNENFRPFLTKDTTLWYHGTNITNNSLKIMEMLSL